MLAALKERLRSTVIKDMQFVIHKRLPYPIETNEVRQLLENEVLNTLRQIEPYCCDIFDDMRTILLIKEAIEY